MDQYDLTDDHYLKKSIRNARPVSEVKKPEEKKTTPTKRGRARIDPNLAIKTFSIRLPERLIEEMDSFVSKRYGMTRTAWYAEAIQEKLDRMKNEPAR